MAATQWDVPTLVLVVKSTVTRCVNENRPRSVAVPVPSVVTTMLVGVGSESVSVPSIVPLKGTSCCAAVETAVGDDVTDAPKDWTDGGLVGDVV